MLFGPLQATSYLLNHGLLSAALCSLWTLRVPVFLMMPACAAVRVVGQAGSIVVTSWALRENLFALVVNNLYALLVSSLRTARCSCGADAASCACRTSSRPRWGPLSRRTRRC